MTLLINDSASIEAALPVIVSGSGMGVLFYWNGARPKEAAIRFVGLQNMFNSDGDGSAVVQVAGYWTDRD